MKEYFSVVGKVGYNFLPHLGPYFPAYSDILVECGEMGLAISSCSGLLSFSAHVMILYFPSEHNCTVRLVPFSMLLFRVYNSTNA